MYMFEINTPYIIPICYIFMNKFKMHFCLVLKILCAASGIYRTFAAFGTDPEIQSQFALDTGVIFDIRYQQIQDLYGRDSLSDLSEHSPPSSLIYVMYCYSPILLLFISSFYIYLQLPQSPYWYIIYR